MALGYWVFQPNVESSSMVAVVRVRQGTLEEALQVLVQVAELAQGRSSASYAARLSGPHLILVAECDGQLAGFKIGYARDDAVFYSWIGGIVPDFRRQGIGQQLLEAQQRWVGQHGYRAIEVKSSARFPSMLAMLVRNGYRLVDEEAGKQLYRKP